VLEPDRGTLPPEETIFKVAYDEDAIHFGVASLEKDRPGMEHPHAAIGSATDIVSVYIDFSTARPATTSEPARCALDGTRTTRRS
jgi:hypothetical protein